MLNQAIMKFNKLQYQHQPSDIEKLPQGTHVSFPSFFNTTTTTATTNSTVTTAQHRLSPLNTFLAERLSQYIWGAEDEEDLDY